MLLYVGPGSKQKMENWHLRRCDCNLSLKFEYLQNDSWFVDTTGSTVVDKANISCIDIINMTINSEFEMYEGAPTLFRNRHRQF